MARLLRAFAFGYSAVLLGVFLENRGLSSFLIGICLGIGLLSGALSGLGFALASARLGRRATVEGSQPGPTLTRRSIGPLAALSSLIAVDALGGGFVVNAVIAYWLHARFHAGTEILGPAFAALSIVQAASYEIAGRLATRFGLVRTMVFTHLPSNLLLVLVPFSPSLPWAVGLLLLRFSISQMYVPARQAYIVSIVAPSERAGAVALTGAVRGVAQAVGPVLAGQAIQSAAFGLPFFLAGGLKIAYDLALYAGFRARKA